jgi:hypothetical protein
MMPLNSLPIFGSSKEHTDDELITRHVQMQKELQVKQLVEHKTLIIAFKEFSAKKGVNLSDENFTWVPTIGIVATASGLLERLIGEIPRQRDRLASLDTLTQTYPYSSYHAGYMRTEHFMIMAHPHFRRGLHGNNNFAPHFIDLFWELDVKGISKFIALDEDRVRVNVDHSRYVEADTWYGAPFDNDISKIQSGLSKLRPPVDIKSHHISFFFADAHSLDVKWSQEKNIKMFQALELKSDDFHRILDGEKIFPARYIHAEFDTNNGVFRHFDGAMQYYTESEYFQRRDSDFNYNLKNHEQIKSRSKKLFKLNGCVETRTWVELCCHFFAGNPLIFEYFAGKYPTHVEQAISRIRERPPDM